MIRDNSGGFRVPVSETSVGLVDSGVVPTSTLDLVGFVLNYVSSLRAGGSTLYMSSIFSSVPECKLLVEQNSTIGLAITSLLLNILYFYCRLDNSN